MDTTSYQRWICEACGFIYDEAKGDPDSGLAPGTRYQDIPDDWQCPLCGMSKSDLRLLPETPAVNNTFNSNNKSLSAKRKGGHDYIVIVGAGIAGWTVAEAFRRRDAERPILLISACKGDVYSKPALSLAISQGRTADDLIVSDAPSRAAELGIEVQTNTRVLKIDTSRKRLTTTRGGIEYDKLILAMGAQQRQLPVSGNAAEQILHVNDLNSFKQLQHRLNQGVKSVTILGAGLIGSEFADDLNRAGYRICVIDPQSRPLTGLVPELMAIELQQRLAAKGVDWKFGVTLQSLEQQDGNLQAQLSDGSSFSTDLVLSAAGLVVNTALAKKSGLHVDNGIAVDRHMQTSDDDIYALGDCASVEGQLYAYIEPIRRQAEAIAADLSGNSEPFMPIPPMVRIKTQSMPMSICRPTGASSDETAWQMVSNDKGGCHFEMLNTVNLVGFALSDVLAAEAGRHYHKLNV